MSTIFHSSKRSAARRLASRAGQAAIMVAAAGLLSACGSVDSFIDPSIVGRWEPTPTSLPILDRISVIEDDLGDLVETTDVSPEDLIADAKEYRIAPGDRLLITLYDLDDRAGATEFPRDVDLQGNIDLPQLGLINVAGRTVTEAQDEIAKAVARFIIDPLVAIVPAAQRQQTFSVVGAVETPGPYFIPRPDYRLLEALTASGRFPESTEELYIIRQVALNDAVKPTTYKKNEPAPSESDQTQSANPTAPSDGTSAQPADKDKKPAENLVDLIDQLAPKKNEPTPAPAPEGQPKEEPKQPENKPVEPKRSSPGVLAPVISRAHHQPAAQPANPPAEKPAQGPAEPPIDLDGTNPSEAKPAGSQPAPSGKEPAVDLPTQPSDAHKASIDLTPPSNEPTWVFVNGEWVMVKDRNAAGTPKAGTTQPTQPQAPDSSHLVTQRVIRVPIKPLMAGDARYNVVIRPGDTIRVPPSVAGLVYMTGQVQRPGPYSLPDVGKLTLLRAIDSAGGLSAIAIPERCDITRIVGKDRQATIRLNLRAINEQTEPDLYLKPDDRINIGTNFWALPLAVLRGGFRTNYGFGFVLDRNFGNDVFGPPPEDRPF